MQSRIKLFADNTSTIFITIDNNPVFWLEIDFEDLLKSLDITKATGSDQISQVMLKSSGDVIAPVLSRLVNLSLSSDAFPRSRKQAHSEPINKKNNNAVVDNYRPVSLLSCKLFADDTIL